MASTRVAAASAAAAASSSSSRQPSPLGSASMEDVWRDISAASSSAAGADAPPVTLEDFLARAGSAATDEDVIGPYHEENPLENPILRFGGGAEVGSGGRGAIGAGRVRKRQTGLDPEDRAAVQRQKRMIKNRESAARSRERKQAYTQELVSLVTQLQEEHDTLLRCVEELKRERLKQLTENVIPVTERREPRQMLTRTFSSEW